MSHEHEHVSFIERYWQPLVIFYGILGVAVFCHFKPIW